eukprot:CAMPEP_0179056394 /NCGR_PEP_ID=MMETSP0796-20121207/23790_1 /TAXON_ID=73915 /ORGANISM="Pyrodinium bahamense, Strain pbaha01" /LENGTH=363 /DNA_ID=CAMNT_0020753069 /DNA_START=21 /DNA_END=1112 /DNA_ORIENTATION=-
MPFAAGRSVEERAHDFARSFVAQIQDFAEGQAAAAWKVFEQEVANQRAALQEWLEDERSRVRQETAAEKAQLAEEWAQLRAEREAWEAEKASWRKSGIGTSDLITLNFGGEKLQTVKRSLLLQVEDSFLEVLFSGRHDERLDTDNHGNVFFDYSPHVMGPLIEYLRTIRDAGPDEDLQKPSIPPEWQDQWKSMLRFFGLGSLGLYTQTFKGVRRDVPLSELIGWTRFYCETFAHPTKSSDLQVPRDTGANALLVATRRKDSDVLAVAAMGLYNVVTRETDSTKMAVYHNGAYWYRAPMKSFGFAPAPQIELNPADMLNDSELRLSWHLDQKYGGWRSGRHTGRDDGGLQKMMFWAVVEPSAFA